MQIELIHFDDLSDAEQEGVSNNGCGKEYANYLRVSHNGATLFLESDAMEPEDCRFSRDLKWIPDALLACFKAGKSEARS